MIETDRDLIEIEDKATRGERQDNEREACDEDQDPGAEDENETSQEEEGGIAMLRSHSLLQISQRVSSPNPTCLNRDQVSDKVKEGRKEGGYRGFPCAGIPSRRRSKHHLSDDCFTSIFQSDHLTTIGKMSFFFFRTLRGQEECER
jgi:hypothetical protein